MTVLRRVSSGSGRFTLTVTDAPPFPLTLNVDQFRLIDAVAPSEACHGQSAYRYHGRVVWQTGGPSLFADVTASYYPLNSPTLTLAIVQDFFADDRDDSTAETWLRVLCNATFIGAKTVLVKYPPVCGGTLLYEAGRFHPVDSNQLAYYRLGRVIAYTAIADHRTLTDEQIYGSLRGV